jgi:3-oxoacyl-[acyl-carrier protein] reductase
VSEFRNRHVAVIGALAGLGPASVRAFAEAGAAIAIDANGAPEAVDELAAAARALGSPACEMLPLDVTDPASIGAFFDASEMRLGALDVLVLAARPVTSASILTMTASDIRAVIEAELVGVLLCMQEAGRRMAARGYGRIISFASMSGKTGVHTGVGAYAAAKAGVIAFSRVLAAELAAAGVTVNVIATALFEAQTDTIPAHVRDELKRAIPVGRFGTAREAGHAVLFLASDDAAYTTGETLNLSGGRFMD